jgi:glycosyltransferase involved in cell wall biosynthesis
VSTSRKKVAIFTTHPIQYQSPWFRSIAAESALEAKVYYFSVPDDRSQGSGFAHAFQWDLPLRDGFANQLLKSIRLSGSTTKFFTQIATGLAAELRDFAPDAVLVMGWNNVGVVQASLTAKRLRIPLIVRGESNAKRQRPKWVSAVQRAYLGLADAFLAIGASNRDFYRRLGVADAKILEAPYFVDNERFCHEAAQRRSQRSALRQAWGIPDGAICALFAGKFEPKKRVGDFLSAVELVHARGVAIHALVVGSGSEQAWAEAFVAERALPVTFAGFLNQTEISSAYVAADALVLPSDFGETWGLVCNEAMACGTPAIVSRRVGCADDLVIDGETGAVVPFADPEAIANVLARWAEDRDLLSAIAERARAHVLGTYSIARANRALLQAMRLVAER